MKFLNFLRNKLFIIYIKFINKNSIKREIVLYSVLAIGGIALFGLTGFMFINSNAMVGYLFLGLAVLTAPHMQIMYDMYNSIRLIKPAEN